MRTRVKICGVTNTEDLDLAVSAGADAIGFNFYPKSPRFLEVDQARPLFERLPPYVTSVGLFVNASVEQVKAVLAELSIGLLQFHGDESDEYCRQFGQPYMKALRVTAESDIAELISQYPNSQGILLDAFDENAFGGTGRTIDWTALEKHLDKVNKPLVLAGGLKPENVAKAIMQTRPFSVDVSSGVEKISVEGEARNQRKKDPQRIKAFLNAVRGAAE